MPKKPLRCCQAMPVEITKSARDQIGNLCEQNSKLVRLSINSGGCQGFSKAWELIESTDNDDVIWDIGPGQLVIDPISLDILQDAVIDYKNDLGGSYFSVDIPAATSTCGCGTSFSI